MTSALRIGVIGTGFGARVVAPVFAATEGCEVIDVVSARDADGVAELCRRDLDLVSVHSPPFLHADHVRVAIAAGHHVLCDKPFGVNADEAAEMLELADASEVVHAVNFEFRHQPARMRVHELVHGGAIGRVEHVQWTYTGAVFRRPFREYGWLFDRSRGGGWVGAWGSHVVDALRWLVGEVRAATARCRVTIPERPDPDGQPCSVDAEDAFTAWLDFESGATAVLDSSSSSPASGGPGRLVVTGTEGVVEVVADAKVVLRRADGTRDEFVRDESESDPHLVPMRRWAEVVRDAVRDGEPLTPSFDDGLACRRVLDRLLANLSGDLGRLAREPLTPAGGRQMERGLPAGGAQTERVEPGAGLGAGGFSFGIVERAEGVRVRESRQRLIERRLRTVGQGECCRAGLARARVVAQLCAREAARHPRFEVVEVTPYWKCVRAVGECDGALGLTGGGEHHGFDPGARHHQRVGVVAG
jgi:predicted dehydrogenase